MNNNAFYDSFNKRESNLKDAGYIAIIIAAFAAVFTSLAAWVTHVVVCIKTSSWILMVFGIVVPPIGFVHGVGSWFGWFV